MNRERLKTLILSVLVVISVILIQQLWFPSLVNTLKAGARVDENNHMTIVDQRKKVIAPKKIIVSFGAGDRKKNYYTILTANTDLVWEESKNIIRDFFIQDPQITPIEYEDYIQYNTLKSIELEFANNIPTILISSIFDSLDNKIVKNIREVKKILVPAFNRGTIYMVEDRDRVYEIKLSDYGENPNLLAFIDQIEGTEYIKYHPISSLFEELGDNYTVMPINYRLLAVQPYVESQIDVNDEAALIEGSKGFFNQSLDFVKTIRETSGAVVYIYGYGEKSVRINNKGALEYNEEIGNIFSTNIVTSLDAAIAFINRTGGLAKDVYLKDVENITSGQNKGYKFSFGYCIGGLPVEFNRNKIENPIEIEVYGSKVKTYRSLIRKEMNIQGLNLAERGFYFPNIIESNINQLKLQYFTRQDGNTEEVGKEQGVLHILKDIEDIQLVYFDTVEVDKRQLLKPSWKIKIKDGIYYFDGYTGELINSVTLN